MSLNLEPTREIYRRVLSHMLDRIQIAAVWDAPFSHTYFEDFFPADIYEAILTHLPDAADYWTGPHDPQGRHLVRNFFNLTIDAVRRFSPASRNLWLGVSAALTDPALKRCLFVKLAPDLQYRYGVEVDKVANLTGFPRPTLYREIEGYELPPHPDTLKKVVTMHLYLPADLSQIHLGTSLYQSMGGPVSKRDPWAGFTKVKQFDFQPNSGYAFVVNNSHARQSWHGRELVPAGSGVRNTLLNTFYADSRPGYSGYVDDDSE